MNPENNMTENHPHDPYKHTHRTDEITAAWTRILREHLANAPGLAVLDAGCGAGFLSILLAWEGWEVTALDHSASILEKAREHAAYHDAAHKIRFLQQDTAHTDLPGDTFDVIVSRYASSQFREPFVAYQEWQRLLKPGGILLNFDANWFSPLWNEHNRREFLSDEQKLRELLGEYRDFYNDRTAMYHLSQYFLAFRERPEWDLRVCSQVGFREASAEFLPGDQIWNSVMSQRFRSIPTFLIKAVK